MSKGVGVAAEVAFVGSRFPSRGANGGSDEIGEDAATTPSPSKKELIAQEAASLVALQKRLSVRDLASKFEQGQTAANAAAKKVLDDGIIKDAVLMDRQSLLKKLRKKLVDLSGRAAGRNKDDAQAALNLLDALAVQVTQREDELAQERSELRKNAAEFHQASADARRIMEEAQALAADEIAAAKAAVQRAESTLNEDRSTLESAEMEALKKEVLEARRIQMLHDSTKVMEMEHELLGLRQQIDEKAKEVVSLRKQLEAMKAGPDDESRQHYQLDGKERLGSSLFITPASGNPQDLASCSFQWYRVSVDGTKELISGAVKSQYSPEPFDVGRLLRVHISLPEGKLESLSTSGPIDPAPGLKSYVDALVKRGGVEFNVVIIQQNGESVQKQCAHSFHMNKDRIKLRRGRTIKAREAYTAAMQLCGARGGGDAAAQGMYWVAKKGLSFMLAMESERERNAAIMLARRFAFDCHIMLSGPDDRAPLGTSFD